MSNAEPGESDLVERVLVSLTRTWSFPEAVDLGSLERRDKRDVIAALEVLEREVVPLWGERSRKRLGERLFASLAVGRVPKEFAEVHIMALTGWSWAALQETPADVVEKMAIYLAVKQARDTEVTLDLREEQSES